MIGPWSVLKEKLNRLVPRRAKTEWMLASELYAPDGSITIFDPSYYLPYYIDPDHIYDLSLECPSGNILIFIQRLEVSQGYWRNAAIKILFSDEPPTCQVEVGDVGVDPATLAIASTEGLRKYWQVGGALHDGSLWIEYMAKAARVEEGKRAAELLSQHGFNLRHEDSWLYTFSDPLSDAEIARVNSRWSRD